MALLKTGIANSLTQGGVKTDIDWSDILAMAIPALSADPNASQQALQGWQIGKALRDAQATKAEQVEAETQGRGLIGDILNAENARTQNIKSVMSKLPGIQAKPDVLPGAESTPFAVDELINNAQAQVQPGDATTGQIVNADTSNFEKVQALADWSKEAKDAENPYDMAALIAKYPKAPISIAASLMTEHFGMKRKEAELMLKASIDNADDMRKYLQQEKLEGIKSGYRKEEIELEEGLKNKVNLNSIPVELKGIAFTNGFDLNKPGELSRFQEWVKTEEGKIAVGAKAKNIEQLVVGKLTQELGRTPTDAEVLKGITDREIDLVQKKEQAQTLIPKEWKTADGQNVDMSKVPDEIKRTAKMVAEYKFASPGGFALRSPYWQQVIGIASEINPDFDSSQWQVKYRLRQDFTSGNASKNIRSLNTAVAHLETLSKTGKDLQNSPISLWNTIANQGLTSTGDSRVTKFNTAATAVAGELAAVFKNTTGTDQEIKAWRQNINSSQSPEQIKGNIDTAIELLGGRLQALTDQYERGLGQPKDFKILSDKSRSILKGLGIDVNVLDPDVKDMAGSLPKTDKSTTERGINNPGNIMNSGGEPAGRRNYNTPEEGLVAIPTLLLTDKNYKGKTVDQAMKIYSNNGYGGDIVPDLTGRPISSLNASEMTRLTQAIIKREGNVKAQKALPQGFKRGW